MKKSLLLILLTTSTIFSQNLSHDESYLDDTFREFKVKLEYVILTRDSLGLKTLLSDTINNGTDDYYLKGEFFQYHFNPIGSSDVWDYLDATVKYGFYRRIDSAEKTIRFAAPCYFKEFQEGFDEGVSRLAILAENLNVRAKPSAQAQVITRISYGLYEYESDDYGIAIPYKSKDKTEWIKIQLPNNTFGYVAKKYTSEDLYFYLQVAKVNDHWKINAFYGDNRAW